MAASGIGTNARSLVPGGAASSNGGADGKSPLDLRTTMSGTRGSYSRTTEKTVHQEYYGDSKRPTGQPLPNFVAAEQAGRDHVIAAQQGGRSTTFHWKAADHRANHEWIWQTSVGGPLGLGASLGAATIVAGVSKGGAAFRALHPVAFWAGSLALGAAAGAAVFLGAQHFFDGRHQSYDGRALPTGTVDAPTAATVGAVPDDVAKLAGTVAWNPPARDGYGDDDAVPATFVGPIGNLAGYATSAAAVADVPNDVTAAVVHASSGRFYALEVRSETADTKQLDAELPASDRRGNGGLTPQWTQWFAVGKNDDAYTKQYRGRYETALAALPPSVTSVVWSGMGSAEPGTELAVSRAGDKPAFTLRKLGTRDGSEAKYEPTHVVAHWAQSGKTTGNYLNVNDYRSSDANHGNVVALDDVGPKAGYATEAEALGDIAARPGDQVVVQQGDRFHVFRTQDGPVLSGQDVLGLTTVAEKGPKTDDYYNDDREWDNSKWGTPVALEELGVTTFTHQGWWLTAGTVQPDATGVARDD